MLVFSLACASSSTSTSEVRELEHASEALRVSARAERGWMEDRLVVSVNGIDVAEGPFGAEQAPGTVLYGEWQGASIEALCGHRWRLGIHISYRCSVYVDGDGPVRLEF